MQSELDDEVIKACQFSNEAIYQSRFIMSIIFNHYEKKRKNGRKNNMNDIYVGVKDIDLWEMDDYHRVNMDEKN